MQLLTVFLWTRDRHGYMTKNLWWILPILFVGIVIAEYINERQRKKENK
jgi:hypothetical protein